MKILITGGCSFTEWPQSVQTWPKFMLDRMPDYQHVNAGQGSAGNGYISRNVIYQVTQALKQTDAKNILVGIMWSGPDRHEVYVQRTTEDMKLDWTPERHNPFQFVPESLGAWAIMNQGWKMNHAKIWYTEFHNRNGALINTLEHILRTQWFLQSKGVRYFMTTYTGDVLPGYIAQLREAKHLLDEIDFGKFLPIVGEYEWCRDFSGVPFPHQDDYHPGPDQHEKFVDQVVIPYLKQQSTI